MSGKKLRHFIRRTSPRFFRGPVKQQNAASTSMQDMNLCGAGEATTQSMFNVSECGQGIQQDLTAFNKASVSMQELSATQKFTDLKEFKYHPKIKTSRSASEVKHAQTRSMKRMRESTLSLTNLDSVMPTPMKRLKPSSSSSDTSIVGQTIKEENKENKKPPHKKFSTRVVASLAKGISPRKKAKEEKKSPVERASSLRLPSKNTSVSRSSSKKYKQSVTPTRRRGSKLWIESLNTKETDICDWTPQQIKRQEAIYELYCGEVDLVEDLKLLQEVYFNPVSKLKLLDREELASIFGSIQALLPLHQDLVRRLKEVRNKDGSIYIVSQVLMEWIPTLRPYIPYCANQLQTKENLLDKIKENRNFSDFLQRCLESPFSRKLDLWSFLDSPRSRLVKYPLLFSNIHKYTPKDHPDRTVLYRTIKQVQSIIKEADRETGVSKCAFYKEHLMFYDENEYKPALDEAQTLICHGCLKTKTGSKVEAFLFDTMFVCSRVVTRNGNKNYHVFTQPMPVNDIEVKDLTDGELRLGGSFRTTLSKGPIAKCAFRVSMKDMDLRRGKSIVLQANDHHDKKQWLNSFKSLQESNSSSSVELPTNDKPET